MPRTTKSKPTTTRSKARKPVSKRVGSKPVKPATKPAAKARKGSGRKPVVIVRKGKDRTYTFSKATRQRMSKAHTGKKLSAETREKISQARRERTALQNMGLLPKFTHTEETKKRLRKLARKRKHRPTKKARLLSIKSRQLRALDKKVAKKWRQG